VVPEGPRVREPQAGYPHETRKRQILTMRIAIGLIVLLALASGRAFAGAGGCEPGAGTYTFHKTSPPPPGDVGTGKFDGNGGCDVNTGGTSEQWEQGADGQYRKVGGDGKRSFCIHDGDPIPYEWKLDGEVISGGDLQP